MKGRWLFRVDAGHDVGLGHLRRAENFARTLGEPTTLILRTDLADLQTQAREIFTEVHLLPQESGVAEEAALLKRMGPAEICVVDFSCPRALADHENTARILAKHRRARRLVVFDGFRGDALRRRITLDCDYLVTPYLGLPDEAGVFAHLNGGKYFFSDPRSTASSAVIRPQLQHIVVSLGGSDPHGVTEQLLSSLPEDGFGRTWTVIMGPAFASSHIEALRRWEQQRPWVRLLHAPADLAAVFTAADLVLVGDGLTKYEVAALGVPLALLSSDAISGEANDFFADTIGCVNLGPVGKIIAATIERAFNAEAWSHQGRQTLVNRMRQLIDGLGVSRIVERIG